MPTKEEKKEDIFYWYVYDDVCSILIGYDVCEDASKSWRKVETDIDLMASFQDSYGT